VADKFDPSFFKEQRELIHEAYTAIRDIRLIFANHPSVRGHKIPDYLYEGRIWSF
jgi:hypothetical protein